MSVVTAFKLDDLVALGEPSGHPDTTHRRLGAAVYHPHPFDRGNEMTDHFGHFHLERIWNPKTETARRRGANGGDHCIRSVPENGWAPRPGVIDQLTAIDRKNP